MFSTDLSQLGKPGLMHLSMSFPPGGGGGGAAPDGELRQKKNIPQAEIIIPDQREIDNTQAVVSGLIIQCYIEPGFSAPRELDRLILTEENVNCKSLYSMPTCTLYSTAQAKLSFFAPSSRMKLKRNYRKLFRPSEISHIRDEQELPVDTNTQSVFIRDESSCGIKTKLL